MAVVTFPYLRRAPAWSLVISASGCYNGSIGNIQTAAPVRAMAASYLPGTHEYAMGAAARSFGKGLAGTVDDGACSIWWWKWRQICRRLAYGENDEG